MGEITDKVNKTIKERDEPEVIRFGRIKCQEEDCDYDRQVVIKDKGNTLSAFKKAFTTAMTEQFIDKAHSATGHKTKTKYSTKGIPKFK